MTPEEKRELKNAVLLAVTIAVWAILFCAVFCPPAKADQIVCFGASWCGPCREMEATENKLMQAGFRMSRVDIDKNPQLAKAYRVAKVPTFVNVLESADGRCYETGRIVGACTEGQLRRLAVVPGLTTVGAATRNAVHALFSPWPALQW